MTRLIRHAAIVAAALCCLSTGAAAKSPEGKGEADIKK